ncbi:MAG: hypothetical protein WCB63_15340, partial [Polyangiales bacterium]
EVLKLAHDSNIIAKIRCVSNHLTPKGPPGRWVPSRLENLEERSFDSYREALLAFRVSKRNGEPLSAGSGKV